MAAIYDAISYVVPPPDDETNPSAEAMIKTYNATEMELLRGYIDQTTAWMQSYGMDQLDSEDVVAIRVGVPYIGSSTEVTAKTIYTSDDVLSNLISTIGIDFIKFTAKDTTKPSPYRMKSFTYKSPVIHRVFGKFYVPGVNNKTGYTYLDDFEVSPGSNGSMIVEYNDIQQLPPLIPEELPDFVLKCIVYLSQNPGLLNNYDEALDDEYVPKGAIEYYRTQDLFSTLVITRDRTLDKAPVISTEDLPLTREEAIRLVLEETGMDKGFTDLKYGGTLTDIRVLIRIPASRDNQEVLEGLLGNGDVFNQIFKEEWINLSDKDVAEGVKTESLNDVYSTELNDSNVDDMYNGYYGCKRSITVQSGGTEEDPYTYTTAVSYRHFRISDDWLQTLTPEKIAIVFWMGLDLSMAQDVPKCTLDKIIITIIIIVITYLTWGTAGAAAGAFGQALLVAGAIVSIATVWGLITPKDGKRIGVALAVLSLGTSLVGFSQYAATVGMNQAIMTITLQIANTAVQIVDLYEQEKFDKQVEALEAEQAEVDAGPEFYASEIRFILGGYATSYIDNGIGANPEQYLVDQFEDLSVYKEKGFSNG